MVEYVKLEPAQKLYGKKNLLYSQMHLLANIKHYHKYRKLRREELALKRLLKKKILETQEEVDKIYNDFPKTKDEGKKPKAEKISTEKKPKKPNTLQREIDDIKRRISELQ